MKKLFSKNKFTIVLFVLIVGIGALFRFYAIQSIPPGVNRDEASIGWTAYSLLHTGKDEYGRLFPLSFESFGDWKLPLYIYTTTISVAVFGLSEFAVRLPSALAGIGTIILVYFIAKELTKNRVLSFLSMLLLAIAPWSIHMSRVGAETNMAVFLSACAIICFLKAFRKNWLFIPSAIFFAFTYYTYAADYVFTTLLVVGLILIYWKAIPKTKYSVVASIVFIILSIGIGLITYGANHTKISGIGIFGDPSVVHAQIDVPRNEHTNPNAFFVKLVNNKIVFAGETFLKNYVNGFSPQFLFEIGGTNHAHNILNFGNGYIVESVFFYLGLGFIIFAFHGKEKKLILLWVLISPIAAAITKDAPHSARQLTIFPMMPLITAFGLYWFVSMFKKSIIRYSVIAVIAFLFVINVCVYIDRYFVLFPYNESASWGFIYRDLSIQLQKSEFANKNIIISKPDYSPYIFLLFYQKYDPATYQQQAVRYPATSDGFYHVKQFGKYTFRTIDWNRDINLPNTVLVDDTANVPASIRAHQTEGVYLPNGEQMFSIITTK